MTALELQAFLREYFGRVQPQVDVTCTVAADPTGFRYAVEWRRAEELVFRLDGTAPPWVSAMDMARGIHSSVGEVLARAGRGDALPMGSFHRDAEDCGR